jgi:hypothetical protein
VQLPATGLPDDGSRDPSGNPLDHPVRFYAEPRINAGAQAEPCCVAVDGHYHLADHSSRMIVGSATRDVVLLKGKVHYLL